MAKVKSKTLISIGFLSINLIIVAFLFIWMDAIGENETYLNSVKETQGEIYILTSLVQIQNNRTNDIHLLIEETNTLKIDNINKSLEATTAQLNQAVKQMNQIRDNSEKSPMWQSALEGFKTYDKLQRTILNANIKSHEAAEEVLYHQMYPLHRKVMSDLQLMLDHHKLIAENGLDTALSRNDSVFNLAILLGGVAILLGFLNIFVVRQASKAEEAVMEQGSRIRKLYEITSKPGLSTEEQIREILKLGCSLLGMEIGKVCQIDIEKNTNSFLNVYAPKGFNVCAGTVMPLDKTFCSITAVADDTIALYDVAKSQYGEKFSHLAAYTATSIVVNGKYYGSVNFSSNKPKPEEFTETDRDLVKLIGSWVSATLERRFSQENLVIAKNEAEAASRTKSSFLANMSHELRTPLNAVIGYSELIKEEADCNGHHMYDKDLHTINSSAIHLLALIDDILDLSKIESGKMEFYMESFSIAELIEEVGKTVTPLISKKNNEFEIVVPENIGEMHSDRMKMKQVLLNLLSNASKFTEEGKVTLEVKLGQRASDKNTPQNEVMFIVQDTGIGISDEQISKIFQAFAQAEVSTTSKYGGTGLGLAISRQICQLLGGDIHAKGELGQGTSFIVTMPITSTKIINS